MDEHGNIVWIDEALTPDSSRFWPKAKYRPGRDQESFDKQYVRNYLEEIKWDKRPETAPVLPPSVVLNTIRKYAEAYTWLVGKPLPSQIRRIIP
jgi:phosphoribosylaminoimidazole-succinocarboxamide synthase